MSAKERILHSMTRSDFVRGTYGVLQKIPLIGVGVRKLVHATMPPGMKLWIQIPDGLGKGLWIYADPRSELGYTNGDHEPWIQELLKAELHQGDCYYDVGAHTGFFCLIASRFVGSSGAIVAFEPDPVNVDALQTNIAKNGLTQVSVAEAAVWCSPGHVAFERASDSSNRTQGHVSSAKDPGLELILVPAVRLDDFIFSQGHPAPHLVKMDVEGAEWEALQGARHLLTEAQPKLLCEVHDPTQVGQIRAFLEGIGYTTEEWNPVHPRYSDYRQLYLWAIRKH